MYTTNFVYHPPTGVLSSLKRLFRVLQAESNNFEQAVYVTKNKQLKDTLLQFLQESKQYVNELKCQIESLGGSTEFYDHTIDTREPEQLPAMADTDTVYDYCGKCEGRILTAYRDILNQSVILKDLRKMVRYQLNGLLCSFLQFKILKGSIK